MTSKQKSSGATISHCTVTNKAFKVDEHVAGAVRSIADAAAANARALEKLADRLAGPSDNRVGIRLDTTR